MNSIAGMRHMPCYIMEHFGTPVERAVYVLAMSLILVR